MSSDFNKILNGDLQQYGESIPRITFDGISLCYGATEEAWSFLIGIF